ncbi:hypothetical protein CRYUN_Cryun33cG0005000 [Craigia yunnanensis]
MTEKKQVERKVTGKKHQNLSPKKLDLKKEMEEVKFLGGLVAEMTAVQEELIDVMNNGLLWNTNANLEGQQITAHQIRQFNSLVSQLNAMVPDYLHGLLDVLDQAGVDKGH